MLRLHVLGLLKKSEAHTLAYEKQKSCMEAVLRFWPGGYVESATKTAQASQLCIVIAPFESPEVAQTCIVSECSQESVSTTVHVQCFLLQKLC